MGMEGENSLFTEDELDEGLASQIFNNQQKNGMTDLDLMSDIDMAVTSFGANSELKPDRKFLLQPNIISRSINDVEATEKKLIALAMSYMPYKIENEDDYTVSFSITDAIRALDLTDGANQRKLLENAVDKISGKQIKIAGTNGDWYKYTWFDKASWQPSNKIFTLTFNRTLGNALVQYKKAYSKIDLACLGRLSSKYSIRYFEIALSFSGNKGINGNKKGTWYFHYTVEELKQLFMIDKQQYKRTCDFTRRVVYQPLELLNEANVGFTIEAQAETKGKKLLGFKFLCCENEKIVERKIISTRKKQQSVNVDAADSQDDNMQKLKEKYPEEYESVYQQVVEEKKYSPFIIVDYEVYKRIAQNHIEDFENGELKN